MQGMHQTDVFTAAAAPLWAKQHSIQRQPSARKAFKTLPADFTARHGRSVGAPTSLGCKHQAGICTSRQQCTRTVTARAASCKRQRSLLLSPGPGGYDQGTEGAAKHTNPDVCRALTHSNRSLLDACFSVFRSRPSADALAVCSDDRQCDRAAELPVQDHHSCMHAADAEAFACGMPKPVLAGCVASISCCCCCRPQPWYCLRLQQQQYRVHRSRCQVAVHAAPSDTATPNRTMKPVQSHMGYTPNCM